jgi:hypothetical protein
MRATVISLLLASASVPALAEEALQGDAFEALVRGRTLTYGAEGQPPRGYERYYSNRRVTWAEPDGTCLEGHWYPKGPQICFAYDGEPAPFCFLYFRDGDRVLSTNPDGREPETSTDAPLDVANFGCAWLGV